jgi:Rtf2 RING-finger
LETHYSEGILLFEFLIFLSEVELAEMGGDGGVLPTGRKFIRGCGKSVEDKKEDGKNVTKAQIMRTVICAQSSEPLAEPIIACEMGNLYSKEAMLLAIINKTLNPLHSHVRGMKDVITLKFTTNPAYSADDAEEKVRPRFICPVTSMEFNGIHPFAAIWSTGYVISMKAIREIGIEALQQDYGPFDTDDVVQLVPAEGDCQSQKVQMDVRREKAQNMKSQKKLLKSSKRTSETALISAGGDTTLDATSHDGTKSVKRVKNELDVKKMKATSGDASKNFGAVSAAGSAVSLTSATSVARRAEEAVQSQESKSKVFKDLFHKGHEADKYDRDLFMSISGLRYTLR